MEPIGIRKETDSLGEVDVPSDNMRISPSQLALRYPSRHATAWTSPSRTGVPITFSSPGIRLQELVGSHGQWCCDRGPCLFPHRDPTVSKSLVVATAVCGDMSVYPIREEDINLMWLLGIAVGSENQPPAVWGKLREGIEATSEGNWLELRAVAIHRV